MAEESSSIQYTASGETLTRGHKKKARTRQALVEAAFRIYARKGVDALALNELAEEAHVANGTVYNYFRTREEVLEAVGIELANQLSHRVTLVSQGIENGAQRVTIGVRMFLLHAQEDPVWGSAVISVFHYHKGMRSVVAAYLRGDLQTGTRQGYFRYLNEDIAMTVVVSTTLGAMTSLVEGVSIPQFDSLVAEMLLMALGVPAEDAARISRLPIPQVSEPEEQAPVKQRGRPRKH